MSETSTGSIVSTLTPEQSDRLHRIREYSFNPPNATKTFESRLARENGWSSDYADRVIEEYRRFAFIFVAADHPVAPSDAVDQVWHQHLLYTRTYWTRFCNEVLGKPLHHEPAAGTEGESAKLGDWYTHTLASYRRFFGEPPADIWPQGQELHREHRAKHRRVNTNAAFILPRSAAYGIVLLTVGLWLAVLAIWVAMNRG